MSDFLTLAEVLAIHHRLIEKYGGSEGVRDMGALESALYRPQSGYYQSVLEEAAALWESLSQNHPFVDGNKRTAFAATYTFLRLNGVRLQASSQAIEVFVLDNLKQGTFEYQHLLEWLRTHTKT
jgi:death on curing protein